MECPACEKPFEHGDLMAFRDGYWVHFNCRPAANIHHPMTQGEIEELARKKRLAATEADIRAGIEAMRAHPLISAIDKIHAAKRRLPYQWPEIG